MKGEAPAWLADLQARFGNVLRTPLDRRSGTLTATPSAYDAELAADTHAQRLAVYNRQYWFRLLDLMHDAFPLTSRLLGAWTFNDFAARFLQATPPRGWDLDATHTGFVAFFAEDVAAHPDHARLVESARIDAAWLQAFRAPRSAPFRPTAADAARLLDAHLIAAPEVVVVVESAPLLALRQQVLQSPGESRIAMPERLDLPRWWAIVGRDTGTLQLPLEPGEAQLLALLCELPVRDALARLEASCPPEARAQLPAKTQAWLARGIQQGFWSGLL